ncbi:unnamed protein product [Lactuca saligna]|uniref:Uncharacterized protein n=1 Tax=Lactuca saligna TaxID=75948 RepID=A0AA36EB19_LACSI|nr:unnamed protein product [Lactuca saligna]
MMEVFSMLKFWRYTEGRDPTAIGDFDSNFDNDELFFDLVFTNPCDETTTIMMRLLMRKILPPDSLKSPRALIPGVLNNKSRLDKENFKIEEVKIGSLLKRDNNLRDVYKTGEIKKRGHGRKTLPIT